VWCRLQSARECGLDFLPFVIPPSDATFLNRVIKKVVQVLIVGTALVLWQRVMCYKAQDELYILHALSLDFSLCCDKE
jgi:hypothetical protein